MKTLFIFLIISCSLFAQQKYFTIEQNTQGGFNFYNNSGELVFKSTKLNSDSLTLQTLIDIYSKADKKDKQQVAVINLQDNGFDINVLFVSLSTLAGIILGWILNRKSTKHQTILQNKKEWLDKFRNQAAETLSLINFYNVCSQTINSFKVIDDETKELVDNSRKFILEKSGKVDELVWSFQFLLDTKNYKHLKLSNDIDAFKNFTVVTNRNFLKAIEIHKSMVEVVKEIIADEQNNINSGKLSESMWIKLKKRITSTKNS